MHIIDVCVCVFQDDSMCHCSPLGAWECIKVTCLTAFDSIGAYGASAAKQLVDAS